MKRLFFISFLIVTMSPMVFAQNSATSQMPGPAQSGYGKGGGAEVFVTGFGLLPGRVDGNSIIGEGTKAGGGAAGYRFHLNASSSLEGRYGFSRNSQKYTIDGTVSSIPVYQSEISASYVYSFAKSHRIKPFIEGGGGVVLLSPQNYGGGTTSYTGDTVPPGSTASLQRQTKGMVLYGIGADLPLSSRLYFRTEFRALGFKTPDFGVTAYRTGAFSFVYEPTAGVAYRF